ncbi:TetR/AcrR family transcriptional regulator [Nocardiopsis trehalosi]|jgi:AcrR family transcriptional regulator|uniref:TetR/AcrR family transcriptional regulator n=1 Tax=Nocardiopsis trehalosi TaxID=109329 RepID=UPI000834F677|nr:TetR family transcriptional regulator [Nocardiopsis trehalosi]
MTSSQARNRRADAQRSRAAIIDAAVRVIDGDPDAGVEAVAAAAGVTRQTVYAHFPGREHLVRAAVDRATEETAAAMDAADPGTGPAAEALVRLLDAAARAAARRPGLVRAAAALPTTPDAEYDRHRPVTDRIGRVVRRGRRSGEFDGRLPVDWQVAAVIALAHTAGTESAAGRLSAPAAADALRTSLLRLLAPDRPDRAG